MSVQVNIRFYVANIRSLFGRTRESPANCFLFFSIVSSRLSKKAVQQSEELIIKDRFDQIKRFVNGKLYATVKIDDIMFVPIYPSRKIRSQNIRMKRRSGEL